MPSTVQPDNRNFLSPLDFQFFAEKLPNVSWFGQRGNVPGLSLPGIDIGNPTNRIPVHGTHLEWENLTLEFAIDEDMQGWFDLFNWMAGMGNPQYLEQYQEFLDESVIQRKGTLRAYSNASLLILASNRRPRIEIKFRDLFPVGLSSIQLSTTSSGEEIIVAIASFDYQDYIPKLISS